ncbi:MAG: hypothetical protein ABJE10_05250 [bacterium]
MSRRVMLLVLIALSLLSGSLEAQGVGTVRKRPGVLRPGAAERREQRQQQRQSGDAPGVQRQRLEQQVRQSFWKVAKQRIGFTDEQMLRVEQTSKKYDVRRRELAQQEKAQRVSLRSEMLADSAANQGAIASSLDKLHDLQRQRLDMQTEEQKELATYMTPLQRAKFLALQEQVRKRLQEIVRARQDSTTQVGAQSP